MRKTRITKAAASADSGPSREQIRRRVIRQLVTGALLVSVLVMGLVVWGLYPKSLTESERSLLVEYEKVRLALAADDLEAAHRSAAGLRSGFSQLPMARQAAALEQASSLESARLVFKEMSRHAVDLARGVDGYFIGSCPGKRCPTKCSPCQMRKFGPWVQISVEIGNPFMGRENPRCGVLEFARR
jgi:hypothetical protein